MPSDADTAQYRRMEARLHSGARVEPMESDVARVRALVIDRYAHRRCASKWTVALVALALVGALAVVSVVTRVHDTGPSTADEPSQTDQAAGTNPAPRSPGAYTSPEDQGMDRSSLEGQADKLDTVSEAAEAFGMSLSVPDAVDGTRIEEIWLAKEAMSPRFLLIVYEDGTMVDITDCGRPDEAALAADLGVDDPQMASLITRPDINGVEAYAMEWLNAAPVEDVEGKVVPGTGVYTGSAQITWASGKYRIRVAGQTRDVAGLLPIARAVVTCE